MADNLNIGIIFKAIDQVTAPLKKINDSMNSLNKTTRNFSSGLVRIGAFFGVSLALTSVVKNSISASLAAEKFRTSLSILTRDADTTRKILEKLSGAKKIIPIDDRVLESSVILLKNAKVEVDRIVPALNILSKLSLGSGANLEYLASTFATISARGSVLQRDLIRLQASGIPIIETLVKVLGRTREQIFELASKGKITSGIVINAFKMMTSESGIFYDAIKRRSESISGKVLLLNKSFEETKIQLGDILLKSIESGIGFDNLAKSIGGLNKILSYLSDNTIFLKGLSPVLAGIGITLAGLVFKFGAWGAAIGIIVTAIGLLITYRKELKGMWDEMSKAAKIETADDIAKKIADMRQAKLQKSLGLTFEERANLLDRMAGNKTQQLILKLQTPEGYNLKKEKEFGKLTGIDVTIMPESNLGPLFQGAY